MPIKIPNDLPAFQTLENENIFVIPDDRAAHQDIRALKIAIVNLMPDKIATETQLITGTSFAEFLNGQRLMFSQLSTYVGALRLDFITIMAFPNIL